MWYVLENRVRSQMLLASEDPDLGHDLLDEKAGCYTTPLPEVGMQYAIAQVLFQDIVFHKIMVQVQSSLFPLYDRNPQTFVDNIMYAKPEDYQKATQSIWHGGQSASAVVLPVVE